MKILIDCTYTERSALHTGVQRVVRSLVRECEAVAAKLHVNAIPVMEIGGQLYPLAKFQRLRDKRLVDIKHDALSQAPRTYRIVAEQMCRMIPSQSLRKWLLPLPGKAGVFRTQIKYLERRERKRTFVALDGDGVKTEEGDVLVLADAYWCHPEMWKTARKFQQRGVKTVVVIYDLIPISHPHFVREKEVASFRKYLDMAIQNADLLVTISRTVADELRSYLVQTGFSEKVSLVRSFCLGAQFDSPSQSAEYSSFWKPSEKILKLFQSNQRPAPYLVVATFEPRKNHLFLLDAFENFWKKHPNESLCLLGKRGLNSETLVQRIHMHSRFNKQLFLFEGVDDRTLAYCYENCKAVICPSIVEGFGLPIVESLWFGKPTFVSDTAIHREVGQKHCDYFGLNDPKELTDCLSRYESRLHRDEVTSRDSLYNADSVLKATVKPITWSESTQQLMKYCVDCSSGEQPDVIGVGRARAAIS